VKLNPFDFGALAFSFFFAVRQLSWASVSMAK
jgi:hypothetical protein